MRKTKKQTHTHRKTKKHTHTYTHRKTKKHTHKNKLEWMKLLDIRKVRTINNFHEEHSTIDSNTQILEKPSNIHTHNGTLIKGAREGYVSVKGARGAEALVKGARGAEALVKMNS